LDRVDDESGRGELVDDLMFEPGSDTSEVAGKQWVQRLRVFWHAAIRWPLWPVTVIITMAVVGVLIYIAVGLIAGFFSGIVD
jgi:hypothetical protein